MLDINPYWSFANMFSLSVGCLFILLLVWFCWAKNLLSLTMSYLFIFAFIPFNLVDIKKKHCCDLCQRVFCLCLPLEVLLYLVLHVGL